MLEMQKRHNHGDNFDALCPAGLYRLVGREPLRYSILGAQEYPRQLF